MDDRLKSVAQGALRLLGEEPAIGRAAHSPSVSPPAGAESEGSLFISSLTLAQLSRLAYLQAGDPLVDQVIEALRSGRPVHMDRPAVEALLELGQYPPRMRETFARWFVRISGFGVHLAQAGKAAVEAPPPAGESHAGAVVSATLPSPEKQVLTDILGGACTSGGRCILEPGKPCTGTGRCKEFGY